MRLIGFDTATDDTVVAATDGDDTLFERVTGPDVSGRPRHSEMLLKAIGEAATAAGGWNRIDRIAVGVGPGTFTGIRIGIATARGFSLSTGVPAVGISTLSALAVGVAARTREGGPVMPLLDARRGEVFAGLYNPAGRELEPPAACPPERLVEWIAGISARLPRPPQVAGPGALRFADQLERAGFPVPGPESDLHRLSGRALCRLGAGITPETAEPLEPIYLRAPDAKIWLERDRGTAPPA